MLHSEKEIQLRKAFQQWCKKDNESIEEYMSKLRGAWIPHTTPTFRDEFDLFVALEVDNVTTDTAWRELEKTDPLFQKEFRQKIDSLRAEWAEKNRNNDKDYEVRKNQIQTEYKNQEIRRRFAKEKRDEMRESLD